MIKLFAELKRRHICADAQRRPRRLLACERLAGFVPSNSVVSGVYAVVAWVLLQLFNNLTPILKLPDWAGTLILVRLIGGFPITILFAWIL
jgi:hypothetical protein